MARVVLVQEVIDNILVNTRDPNSALATEAQLIQKIDRAHSRLYSMYLQAEPDRYRTEATMVIEAPPDNVSFALPEDWFSTVAVDRVDSSNRRSPLQRLQEQDRNDWLGMSGDGRAYRVLGEMVFIYPAPREGETYVHAYLPTAPVVTAVDDELNFRMGHEQYVEMVVSRTMLQTEESYDKRWDEEIAKIEAELKLEANMRYFHDSASMSPNSIDPFGTGGGMGHWPWPRRGNWGWW